MKLTALKDLKLTSGHLFMGYRLDFRSNKHFPYFEQFLTVTLKKNEAAYLEYGDVYFDHKDDLPAIPELRKSSARDGDWILEVDSIDSSDRYTLPGVFHLDIKAPFPKGEEPAPWHDSLPSLSDEAKAALDKNGYSAAHIVYLHQQGQCESWGIPFNIGEEISTSVLKAEPTLQKAWGIDTIPKSNKPQPAAAKSTVRVFKKKPPPTA